MPASSNSSLYQGMAFAESASGRRSTCEIARATVSPAASGHAGDWANVARGKMSNIVPSMNRTLTRGSLIREFVALQPHRARRLGEPHELRAVALGVLAERFTRRRDDVVDVGLATMLGVTQQEAELGHRCLKLEVQRGRPRPLGQDGPRQQPALVPLGAL